MEKIYLNKWTEMKAKYDNTAELLQYTSVGGTSENKTEPHKIKIDRNIIKIDDEEYEYLDSNDMYHLYLDKNGNPQEIRTDGYYDSEIL